MRPLADPPAGEPPERLFRSLLAFRPERRLETEIAGHALSVRALSTLEELGALDAAAREPAEELRPSIAQREILFRALRLGAGPAFASAEEVGLLPGAVLDELVGEVARVLSTIAPTYSRSNVEAWKRALEKGAEHPTNVDITIALAGCVDVAVGFAGVAFHPRPERFWRCALGELLDGHWMAFRAARAVVNKYTSK